MKIEEENTLKADPEITSNDYIKTLNIRGQGTGGEVLTEGLPKAGILLILLSGKKEEEGQEIDHMKDVEEETVTRINHVIEEKEANHLQDKAAPPTHQVDHHLNESFQAPIFYFKLL